MTDTRIKTGVIGHPIAHSKSPFIHSHWFDLYKLSGLYTKIDTPPENLKQDVQNIVDQGFVGFNVTVPHKVSIMALCDHVDELAQKIGAVNTVTIKDGKLYGTNTDAFGFIENIKETVQRNNWGWDFKDGKAVIFGAGGAANAIIYALLQEGVPEIVITNRTLEKAQNLTTFDPSCISAQPWDNRNDILKNANLIVNTTSLGMEKQPALEIDLSHTPNSALVNDIVYAPLYTDLLTQAKNKGLKTVTGIGMLLHQARPGFELWNGILPDVTPQLEKLILK